MNTFDFAGSSSASPVAAAVTFAVSAWFLVAAGLMVTENPADSPAAEAAAARATSVVYSAPAVAIAPEARLIIVVEGRRA